MGGGGWLSEELPKDIKPVQITQVNKHSGFESLQFCCMSIFAGCTLNV